MRVARFFSGSPIASRLTPASASTTVSTRPSSVRQKARSSHTPIGIRMLRNSWYPSGRKPKISNVRLTLAGARTTKSGSRMNMIAGVYPISPRKVKSECGGSWNQDVRTSTREARKTFQ